jgi:threonine/homoserine/homoserine lactone efflux protein
MMEIVLKGFQFGIVLALLIGPVFFLILQTSIERGFFYGVMVAIGVSISDSLYVAIGYLGIINLVNNPGNQIYLAFAGGGILIAFGIYHILVKGREQSIVEVKKSNDINPFRYVLKGFVINGLNPAVLFFWIGTISLVSLDFGYAKGSDFYIFFGALLATVLLTDILKAFLSDKLRNLVTGRFIRLSNIILGMALIVFGLKLIVGKGGV